MQFKTLKDQRIQVIISLMMNIMMINLKSIGALGTMLKSIDFWSFWNQKQKIRDS